MQMNLSSRGGVLWPLALAVIFFSIPVLLALQYPSSFWMGTDNETLGLADALGGRPPEAVFLAVKAMHTAVALEPVEPIFCSRFRPSDIHFDLLAIM